MAHRCRLCAANDGEALIEELSERLWFRHRGGMDDWPWPDCGPNWQRVFRGFAEDSIDLLGKL